jgi:two-component system, sensor histidine kinase RpfC
VTDTGIGIDPNAQARIFDRFVQADETIIDRFGGTGLGLALVKQLVELHGGEVGVASTPGVGSTFWCEIEFAAAAAPPAWSAGRVRVVLLSNDAALRDLVDATGAAARVAATMAEAAASVAHWADQGRRPTLIVDARLIGDDSEARARQFADTAALILVADAPMAGLPDGAVRSAFVSVLARPLDAASLLAALQIAGGGGIAEKADDAAAPVLAGGRSLTVLVAEDNRTNQKVIAKVLERAGHATRIVDNGEAAIDALAEQAFDIVLMDVNMPVMNGIETTKLYRFAALGQPRVPILGLTADATVEMDARCREAGMDGCVTKPIEPARLLQIIDAMVGAVADAGASRMPREGVSEIASHPKFQAGAAPALNTRVLDDLRSLGGDAFVTELAAQFTTDAAALAAELAAAAAAGDAATFRERAHALRSGAANVGAQGIYEMCLAWRTIEAGALAAPDADHVAKLEAELARVRAALGSYLATLVAGESDESSLVGAGFKPAPTPGEQGGNHGAKRRVGVLA